MTRRSSEPPKPTPLDRAQLRPEIKDPEELPPIPLDAIAALEDMRRKRALIGIPGYVSLKVHDAPGKPPEWSVTLGEVVVRSRKRRP